MFSAHASLGNGSHPTVLSPARQDGESPFTSVAREDSWHARKPAPSMPAAVRREPNLPGRHLAPPELLLERGRREKGAGLFQDRRVSLAGLQPRRLSDERWTGSGVVPRAGLLRGSAFGNPPPTCRERGAYCSRRLSICLFRCPLRDSRTIRYFLPTTIARTAPHSIHS